MSRIPDYIRLQFIYNYLKNKNDIERELSEKFDVFDEGKIDNGENVDLLNNNSLIIPNSVKWNKINYLLNKGYLGENPGIFFDNCNNYNIISYLNRLLKIDLDMSNDENYSNDNDFDNLSNINITSNSNTNYKTDNTNEKFWNLNFNNKKVSFKDLSIPKNIKCKFLEFDNESKIHSTNILDNQQINNLVINRNNNIINNNNNINFLTVKANCHISPLISIYYYEVEIIRVIDKNADFVIGYMKDQFRDFYGGGGNLVNNNMNTNIVNIDMRSGLNDIMVSWYGKTGNLVFWNDVNIDLFISEFGINDTIGIGYNLFNDCFFLTKNGLLIREVASVNKLLDSGFDRLKNLKGLIPCITLTSYNKVKINLGEEDFKFNINNYVLDFKHKCMNKIKTDESVNKTEIIGKNSNLSNYTDKLVLDYLKASGFTETFKSMKSDLKDLNSWDIEEEYEDDLTLCELKKKIKSTILNNEFKETKKILDNNMKSFLVIYRKIDFKLRILELILMLINKEDIKKIFNKFEEISNLFKEDDCQNYLQEVSILLTFNEVEKCEKFDSFFNSNKIKLIYAIIMAINEQNRLPVISSLDLIILKTDQKIERLVNIKDKTNGKKPNNNLLLINLLQDYINL